MAGFLTWKLVHLAGFSIIPYLQGQDRNLVWTKALIQFETYNPGRADLGAEFIWNKAVIQSEVVQAAQVGF